MIIKIESLDTLFFRDGKPFTMGEDTWANAVFPPYPSVIYGALRSTYFSNHPNELKKANENDDPTKNLKINEIYFIIGYDYYLPLPLDCVKEKTDKTAKVKFLSLQENRYKSNCPTEYVLKYSEDKEVENIANGLIRLSMFKKYLALQENHFSIMKLDNYVLPEPKIGIGIDPITRTSGEGKLYRVDMRRLKNISLLINFEGLNLPEKGMIKLGGEGKATYYEKYNQDIPIDTTTTGNRFKIYLSTPAIFKNGWLPEWIDEKTLEGKYNGIKLKLLTATIGKPINIGGFDMKNKKPKPTYKAVPSGSVFYFELIEGDIQKAVEVFNQTAISEFYPEQGFGIAYAGKIKEER